MGGKTFSLVVNLDTREGFLSGTSEADMMGKGVRSIDFILDGLQNRLNFFRDLNLEVTLFVDLIEPLPSFVHENLIQKLQESEIDNLVIHTHSEFFDKDDFFPHWLDLNFLQALFLARGEYLIHTDGDLALFSKVHSELKEWVDLLDRGIYDYVSYPTVFSPYPDPDLTWEYNWASTRFFICRRETIQFSEVLKCLQNSDYLYSKYGDKKRKCPWLEHILGIIAGKNRVYYPPRKDNQYLIFCWGKYQRGLLSKLNKLSFDEVKDLVDSWGGIQNPCEVYPTGGSI